MDASKITKASKQKPCPFPSDELAALDARKSMPQMAADFRQNGTVVSGKLLYRWLREAGIGWRAPGSLERLACPLPAPRLHELYNVEGNTVREIAALAAPLLGRGRAVPGPTVAGWLRAAGVPLRTNTEARRLRARLHPEWERGRDWYARMPVRVERLCAWCGRVVSRQPCRMRRERVFCDQQLCGSVAGAGAGAACDWGFAGVSTETASSLSKRRPTSPSRRGGPS